MANLTDWLSFSVISGESGTTTIQVSATENTGERNRYAIVEFENEENLKETYTVNQYRQMDGDVPEIDPDNLFFYQSGGSRYLHITYDKPFIINNIPPFLSVAWISVSGGVYHYRFVATENTTGNDRTGTIVIDTPYGQYEIPVLQVTYNPTLTITPDNVYFAESGGSSAITVESVDYSWSASSNNNWISLSRNSGESGTSNVTVTASAMTDDIDLHTTFGRVGTVTFTNGEDTKVLTVNMTNTQTGAIDDDWVTCYYTIDNEDVGEEFILIYNDATIITSGLTSASTTATNDTDVYYITEGSRSGMYDIQQNLGNGFYRLSARFASAGTYIVKYRFHDDIVIPPRALGYGELRYGTGFVSIYVDNLTKVVVGNKCNGYIGAISCCNQNIEEVVLGNGTLFIYCCAFKGAGSKDNDFIFPSGATIEDVCSEGYEAFGGFKCKNFILQKSIEGGLQGGPANISSTTFIRTYMFRGSCQNPGGSAFNKYYSYAGRKLDLINFPHFLVIDYDTLMIGKDCTYLGEYVFYRYKAGLTSSPDTPAGAGFFYENQAGRTTNSYYLGVGLISNLSDNVVFLNMPDYDINPFSHGMDSNYWAFKYDVSSTYPSMPPESAVTTMQYTKYLPDVNTGKTAYIRTGTNLPSDLTTTFTTVNQFSSWLQIANL